MSESHEIHKENAERIEMDASNLNEATQQAWEYMTKAGEEAICFPALIPLVLSFREHMSQFNREIAKAVGTRQITISQASELMQDQLATMLLEMYFVGHFMGKAKYDVWTHIIPEVAVDEAEHILHTKGRWRE